MKSLLKFWVDAFVLWVIVFSVVAWFVPEPFAALKDGIKPGLGMIMFGMGMTLLPADFLRVAKAPRAIVCGIIGQFLLMPFIALALVKGFGLSPELSMGFIFLGACPGGTASNVVAYLAKADVALSVTMTACSTVLGVVLTPVLIYVLGGDYLPVDPVAMFKTVVTIVLVPVGLGVLTHHLFQKQVERGKELFPALSVLIIVLIIACIVALSREQIAQVAGILGVVVTLHNGIGLLLGYALAALFRLPEKARRTVAIEVGMQNSGLGMALARSHFDSALVALPSSLFSIVHNLTGSALASVCRRLPDKEG